MKIHYTDQVFGYVTVLWVPTLLLRTLSHCPLQSQHLIILDAPSTQVTQKYKSKLICCFLQHFCMKTVFRFYPGSCCTECIMYLPMKEAKMFSFLLIFFIILAMYCATKSDESLAQKVVAQKRQKYI